MKFAVIGCGSIGRRHIQNLLSLGHEVVAWNRGDERRNKVARDFAIHTYSDLSEMLNSANAEAAFVCSPNQMHIEDAILAARTGHHLFIEKPLAVTPDGLVELNQILNEKKLKSHVACNMRFHFGPKKIYDIINDSQLGRVLWANLWGGMHLPDWHPDEDYRQMYSAKTDMGGGALLDFIHEIDLSYWLFGMPERIASMVSHSGWLDIETEDVVDIILGYNKAFQAVLHLDYLQKPFQRGIRVVGEKGWVEWDMVKKGVEFYSYEHQSSEFYKYPSNYDNNIMYLEQCRYFIDTLNDDRRSFNDLRVGQDVLDIALRCKKSSEQNKFF